MSTSTSTTTNPIQLTLDSPLSTLLPLNSTLNPPLPNESWTPLMYFVSLNDLPSVKKLVQTGIGTGLSDNEKTLKMSTMHTPLHVAARFGSVDCMEALVDGRVSVTSEDNHEYNESQIKSIDVSNSLVSKANVNAYDRQNFTPLHYATTAGSLKSVEKLLKLGANSALLGGPSMKLGCIDIARLRGYTDIINLLTKWTNKSTNPSHERFKSWLTLLDCSDYYTKFVEAGYDLDFISAKGLTGEDLDCVGVGVDKLGVRRKLIEKWRIGEFIEAEEEEEVEKEEEEEEAVDEEDEEDGEGSDSGSGSGSEDERSGSGSDSESGSGSGSGSGSDHEE